MKKRLRITIFISFLLAGMSLYAQTEIKSAREKMALYNYSGAAEILNKEVSKNKDHTKCQATLLLAECYRMMDDIPKSRSWFAKAIEMSDQCRFAEEPGADIFDHYAQVLRSSGEYRQAKNYFLHYDSLVPGQHRGALFASYCDSAAAWQVMKPEFEIRNVSVLNSPQSEFGIVSYRKGIIFTSDRISSLNADKTYGWTGNSYLNLYYAELVNPDSTSCDFRSPLPATDLPDQAWHDGPVTFDHDFTKVFLNQTQTIHDKGKKDTGKIRTHLLKIFCSYFIDGKWSTPEPFFLNSDNYSVGHPALSPDGKTLFYVSDMPGGYGETDIWYCREEGNKWSEPVNPGPGINTPGKEMFPFMAANGDLYFASDGLPGFGGLDLFVTREKAGQWSTPQNLGWPLNSSYDDFSLFAFKNSDIGLFSSNRPGGEGGDDIYSFRKIGRTDQKRADSVISITSVTKKSEIVVQVKPETDTLQLNRNYRLENIFYNFDKWNIRPDAKPSLDKLVSIMKEYPVSVELGSHTDCRGTEEYNMQLSQKRAESAVQYIISRGISASRITAKGYGKSHLLNRCDCSQGIDCTEAEHQFNRRTEFKIVSMNKQ